MRRAHFTIEAGLDRFDGARRATVTITVDDGGRALFTVRPYRRRNKVEIPLDQVVNIILVREARLRAEARRRDRMLRKRGAA